MKSNEGRWKNTRRKTEVSWASALEFEMSLPPEQRDKKRIARLKKKLGLDVIRK